MLTFLFVFFSLPFRTRTPPKVIVKQEPTSPEPERHRPSKLNLSKTGASGGPSATPRTAKGNLSMQEVGMACLSPGLAVQDAMMREQLERSRGVREQQRSIIESRLHRNAQQKDDGDTPMGGSGLMSSRGRRRPPSALSIVPPHHGQFANERIIQSAPLNQSFTVRRQAMAEARHERMANRLPPIADVVFGPERTPGGGGGGGGGGDRSQLASANRPQEHRSFFPGNSRQEYASPRLPPSEQAAEKSDRPREYKSAEEAVQGLSGGREDLLPKIIHYGGHQPPTPPSPNQNAQAHAHGSQHLGQPSSKTRTTTLTIPATSNHEATGNKRRRLQNFDRDDSTGSDADTNDAESKRRKKEEFLSLCARAWDLFHS